MLVTITCHKNQNENTCMHGHCMEFSSDDFIQSHVFCLEWSPRMIWCLHYFSTQRVTGGCYHNQQKYFILWSSECIVHSIYNCMHQDFSLLGYNTMLLGVLVRRTCRQRQKHSLKCLCFYTKLHNVISQNTAVLMAPAMRTSNIITVSVVYVAICSPASKNNGIYL